MFDDSEEFDSETRRRKTEKCKKCFSWKIDVTYCPERKIKRKVFQDKLIWNCNRCGYEWETNCKDNKK